MDIVRSRCRETGLVGHDSAVRHAHLPGGLGKKGPPANPILGSWPQLRAIWLPPGAIWVRSGCQPVSSGYHLVPSGWYLESHLRATWSSGCHLVPSASSVGAIWLHSGGICAPSGAIWVPPGCHLGALWVPSGAIWLPSVAHLGAIWCYLGAICCRHATRPRTGGSLDH